MLAAKAAKDKVEEDEEEEEEGESYVCHVTSFYKRSFFSQLFQFNFFFFLFVLCKDLFFYFLSLFKILSKHD